MSEQPRPIAVLAAAMWGVCIDEDWVQTPMVVDVDLAMQTMRADPPLTSRYEAIRFARELADRVAEVEGYEPPDLSPVEEVLLCQLLGDAYDRILVEL